MKNLFVWIKAIALLSSCSVFAADDDHWDTRFGAPGADGLVNSMTTSGSNLFLTGSFTSAGEAGCVGVAKWDGTNWAGFGSGFSLGSGPVGFAIATHGTDIYVGGAFITNISGVTVRSLAKWNGSSWSDVSGGVNGVVQSLRFKGNDLYVGGLFSQAGGITASNIARWDGTNWYPLGTGLTTYTNGIGVTATSMTVDWNGDLIVAGNFRFAGGVEVNNIARWDGANWNALGTGLYNGGSSQLISAVTVLNSNLYVAGLFKSAGGVNATNLARWDGSQWYSMGGGPSGTNTSLAVVGTTLYTAGNFTSIGGAAMRHVARWNGSAWEALAPGTAGEILTKVSCLASDGVNLYAGSDFVQAGTAGTLCVAKWDGIQWSALTGPKSQGTWLSSKVISAAGNDVYVGGSGVLIAGGLKPNKIAHWNGSVWDNVGGGVLGGDVNAILQDGNTVYVGGLFTNAGGVVARNVAYWDGASWHAMASGLNNSVLALCSHQGQIFAGGSFTARGDGTGGMPGIARWNGSDWTEVPTISSWRINNIINALVSDGTRLYVGGNYYIGWQDPLPPHNGADLDNIGYWDGNNWWSLGTDPGLANTVNSLTFIGSDLYACGSFTNSGATTARRLAKWNGSAWSEVGGGITNGTVSTIAAKDSTLFVGGTFTNAGGISGLNRLAKWDGQWHGLGSGISRLSPTSSSVVGISITGDDVYMVGSFTYAGGRPAAALGHWNETVSFVPPIIRLLNFGTDIGHQYHFDIGGLSSGTFTIQASTNLTNWTDIHSDTVPNTNFTDVDSPNLPRRIYRIKLP